MSREYTEITLHTGDVNLIDLTGEGELFGRDEIEAVAAKIVASVIKATGPTLRS